MSESKSHASAKGKPRGKPRGKPTQPSVSKSHGEETEHKAPLPRKISIERKESLLTCILCCHVIDNATRFNTVGVCGHTGCCSLCSMRMRQLLGTTACPICKSDLPRVICIERESQTFDSFQDWGDNIGPTHVFDDVSGIFFLKSDFPHIRKLRESVCPKCDKKFANVSALKTHVQDVHHVQYCGICLEHKKVFLGEQELFSKEQLKAHSTKGNPKEGFMGHPRCDFCFTRFYSNTELFDHLHKNHYECDICVRSQGVQNRYYKDYHDLENHFRAEHFLCEEPECLMKKFVVFKTHIDFQGHMTSEHPHIKISRKIDVHFTVRRATNDGTNTTNDGFEDPELFSRLGANGNSNDNVINVADFPSLSNDGPSTGQMQFWEQQRVTRPRMDDFPSLPTAQGSRGGGNAIGSAFRNALAPPPTPAMLAHMDNSNSWEYPELAAAAEALGANNPLMRFVKPAKGKMKKKGKPSPTANSTAARTTARVEEEQKPAQVSEEEQEEERADSGPDMSKSALVLKIRQELGTDAKYEVFREECRKYRVQETDVASFYNNVRSMFSEESFEKLFLKLMKLSPDRAQVDEVVSYHKQRSKKSAQVQGFQDKQPKKKPQSVKKAAKPPPQASGWANALRQSGVAASSAPISVVAPRPTVRTQEPARSIWTPSPTHRQHAGPVMAESSTDMPSSSKIVSAPVDSFAAIALSGNAQPTSYAASTTRAAPPTSFRNTKSDFPDLPKAAKPTGVQPVTRATWDEQVQSIAQNRPTAQNSGKKKQKKKLTLGELAMQFS